MNTPIADMVERMLSGGISAELIVDAIRAAERHAQVLVSGDPAATRRRAYDRERKRLAKEKNSAEIPQTNSGSLSSLTSFLSEKNKEEKEEVVTRARARPRTRAAPHPLFPQFWDAYPHKVGKIAAEKAFPRALQRAGSIEVLMKGVAAYAAKTDDRPWCNPATWLNEGRWDDKPGEQINGKHRKGGNENLGFSGISANLRVRRAGSSL